ncbi:hypothetical protein K3495_g16825 [Podosphaera aphanis]|nr:hypothetical protein K3495_g16825 [Podosphaera aphanis]
MNTSDSDIQSAIRAFNDGTFTIQKAAAKAYDVPRSTFRSRLNGSRGQAIAQQHRWRLSFDQEEFLTEWILNEDARGRQMGTISHSAKTGSPASFAAIQGFVLSLEEN